MTNVTLTEEEIAFMRRINDGVTVFDRQLALLVRGIDEKDAALLELVPVPELKKAGLVTGDLAEPRPYFGVLLKEKGAQVLSELKTPTIKVFQIDDSDFLAAPSFQEAKEFWIKQTGHSLESVVKDFAQFGREVPLDEVMFIPVEALPDAVTIGEIREEIIYKNGIAGIEKPFSWILKKDNVSKTQMIASFET